LLATATIIAPHGASFEAGVFRAWAHCGLPVAILVAVRRARRDVRERGATGGGFGARRK